MSDDANTSRFEDDAWTDEPTFIVKWTDHTDGRRYRALVPEFALADLTMDERERFIGLWEVLEPTPARAGGLLLAGSFEELAEPGERVTMTEIVGRIGDTIRPVMEGAIDAIRELREGGVSNNRKS